MATPTPNRGYPIPDAQSNTEIWTHITDLGNAIDADMNRQLTRESVAVGISTRFKAVAGHEPRLFRNGTEWVLEGMLQWVSGTIYATPLITFPVTAAPPNNHWLEGSRRMERTSTFVELLARTDGQVQIPGAEYITGGAQADRGFIINGRWPVKPEYLTSR